MSQQQTFTFLCALQRVRAGACINACSMQYNTRAQLVRADHVYTILACLKYFTTRPRDRVDGRCTEWWCRSSQTISVAQWPVLSPVSLREYCIRDAHARTALDLLNCTQSTIALLLRCVAHVTCHPPASHSVLYRYVTRWLPSHVWLVYRWAQLYPHGYT